MATSTATIRTLTIKATTEGVDEAKKSLQGLAGSADGVAASSSKMEKSTLSTEAALAKLQRQVDSAFRAQQNMAKAAQTLERAQAQGLITQERANELQQQALKHYNSSATAMSAQAKALQELSTRATGAASQLGAMGSILSALGPAGLAAAAALGVLTLGMKQAADAALALGDRAGKLRDLSETVGFTAEQLQGLERAAGRTGVNPEQLSTSIEKFSVSLGAMKDQSGEAFKALEQINPGLARVAATADDVTVAFNAVAEALMGASKEDANFAARSIFGRGGVGMTRVIREMQGDLDGFTESLRKTDLITQEQAEHWDDLFDSINENMKLASQIIASLFTEQVLDAINKASELFVDLARAMQDIPWDDVTSGAQTVANAVQLMINPLQGVITLWNRLKGLEAGEPASGSPAGLPGAFPRPEPAATGSPPSLPDIEALERATVKLGRAHKEARKEALDYADVLKNNVAALGDAATEAEKYQSKLAGLAKQLQEGKISQDTFNRAVSQLPLAVTATKDVVKNLGDALSSAFINGADAAEAFDRALKSIATTAASKSLDKILTGVTGGGFDLPSIGINAAVSLGATIAGKLFGGGAPVRRRPKSDSFPPQTAESKADARDQAAEAMGAANDNREQPHDRDQRDRAA